jgi:hypothetical protein
MKSSIFWDTTQCSALKSADVSEENFASIFSFEEYAEQETRVKAGGKQSSATYFSETSADFQRTTRRCIPEDRTLQF